MYLHEEDNAAKLIYILNRNLKTTYSEEHTTYKAVSYSDSNAPPYTYVCM
jgi:hypothetical protein